MILLQKFGFKESRYERPQDMWVCGHLAAGKPCALGPDLNGLCRVTTVCRPRLEKDRWKCLRSAAAGGPCQAGPLPDGQCCMTLEPCEPRRSLRALRKRVTLLAMAFVVGILAFALAGEGAQHLLMPGKLSSPHAGATECTTCHAGARSGQVDLLHRLVTKVEPRENANLCLTCHAMGSDAFTPHTHPVENLKRLTETLRLDPLSSARSESLTQRIVFSGVSASANGVSDIYCATCHKEHRGVFADLRTVSNERCQSCHVSRFGSFADSHPEFRQHPYYRRPRIMFSHQNHRPKYFLPENLKITNPGQERRDCTDCHRPGTGQKYMAVKSYASMCGGCHEDDITGKNRISGPKGIDVIAVPGLDLATLRKRGIDIGAWPEDSKAVVTPFMRPLLSKMSSEDVVSGVARLKLLDLSEATDAELARVAALAWAVKRLFSTLRITNPAAAAKLAGNDIRMQADLQVLAALTGGMPRDVILLGSQQWFPTLQDDLQRRDRGEPTSDFKLPPRSVDANRPSCADKSIDATAANNAENWAQTGGWYREDCTIRYRPAGHADSFLRNWLDFSGAAYASSERELLAAIFEELARRDDTHDPIGRCTKCHSVDDQAGAKIVNWRPFDADAITNRFTNFSHKPHTELVGTRTCLKCHELNSVNEFLKTYEAGDPFNYTPNFKPMEKAACAACHSTQAAWEKCTFCHGYHVLQVELSSRVPVSSGQANIQAASLATPAAVPSGAEDTARRDYAKAQQTDTAQAWEEFVANYPSGEYHDRAIQQIARLKPDPATRSFSRPTAPDAPAASDSSSPVTADKPAEIPADSLASPAPLESARVNTNTPANLDSLFRRGLERATAGDYRLALEDFNEVIRRDARHASALNNRCWVRAMLNEVQAALQDCDASLRIMPGFVDALDSRGLVNLKLGSYKDAIADYTSALSKDPRRASALFGRGMAKRRIGNRASANADIDAAKRIEPTIVDEFASYGIR